MTKQAENRTRGRPSSPTEGAPEAFDFVESFRLKRKLSKAKLAQLFNMPTTVVSRALHGPREKVRLTPGLRDLYSSALNWRDPQSTPPESSGPTDGAPAEQSPAFRLARYTGPGEALVQRILRDVAELVDALGVTG